MKTGQKEGTLSGFHDFFLQPIIKDRSNDNGDIQNYEQNILLKIQTLHVFF